MTRPVNSDRRRVAWAYGAALVAVSLLAPLAPADPVWRAAVLDVAATVVVFAFSLAWNNSSVYDPYWSVAPPLIVAYWLLAAGAPAWPAATVLVLVAVWSLRLTGHWLERWRGLDDEDWRYRRIRRQCGRAYWPASLFGIHLLPTALVFLGCLPLAAPLWAAGPLGSKTFVLGAALTAAAIAVEATADRALRRHRNAGRRDRLQTGLWRWSRHPNYWGEIGFWWGLYLMGQAAGAPTWTIVGAVAITVLFAGYSFPAMNRRLAERPEGEIS